ncbi:tetratricopeptide repeat domain protein [Halomicronema hongdechloris C2206]|uniref:Tetratricopeptide repeat domain protein n=1 Tax=Halomicronema hongdechloris C2206 TaxID=1641165 RepID=A0A1Z3HUW7_9CYAN|nr:tetratricopeptide repeat protein [Halomicronema hongdechloris]ASC74111.1 tetratricopeptide repeat domain protein [Halomicronema hongdechloris C2206]
MGCPDKFLGLVAATVLVAPALQLPGWANDSKTFQELPVAQVAEPTALLQVDGVLEQGDTTLSSGHLVDYHSLEGQAGQAITIRLSSDDFDPFLGVLTAEGEVLGVHDNLSVSDTNASLTMILPADGAYSLGVTSSPEASNGQGRYRLIVVTASAAEVRRAEAEQLLQQGIQHYRAGQFQAAADVWETALEHYQDLGDRSQAVVLLINLGDVYTSLGQYPAAVARLEQALEIAQSRQDPQQESDALNALGWTYVLMNQYRLSITYSEQALALHRQIGDLWGEARALNHLGLAYYALNDYRQAITYYEQALPGFHQVGDRRGEANALMNLGSAHWSLSDYRQAIAYSEQALPIFQSLEDIEGEAKALTNLGNTYLSLSDYRQAITYYEQALPLFQQIESPLGQANVLMNLGLANNYLSDYRQAIGYYEQALPIFQAIGDRLGAANVLMNVGNAYFFLSDYRQAITYYEEALPVFRSIENRQGEANALMNLGNAHNFLSEYQQAIVYYKQALPVFRTIEDRLGQANVLTNLGNAYLSLSDYHQATVSYEQALPLFQAIENRLGEANALMNLGLTNTFLSLYQEAITYYQQALKLFQQIEDRQGKANALSNLGLTYWSIGDPGEAIAYYERSLPLFQAIENRSGEANTLMNLGLGYFSLGDYQTAATYYEQALPLFQTIEDRAGEGRLLSNLGRLFAIQGQSDLAIIFYKASVNVRESIRSGLTGLSQSLQETYTESVANDYRALADLLLEQGRIPEAQQVLDLLQLEELREFTETTRATWSGGDLQYTEREQPVIDTHGSLITLGRQIYECRQTRCGDLTDLRQQQRALTEQYEAQVAAFETAIDENRQDDDLFQNPGDLSDDAYKLLQANPDAVLIYPFVTEDKLWLLWAAAGGTVGSVEVPVSQGELATAIQQFGDQLNTQAPLSELQASSQRLYEWLIQPLAAELQANGIRQLIFVNDRVTRYVPMAALYDGSQYLLERYTVSTVIAPKITDTAATLTEVDDSEVLGLGLTQAVSGFAALPAVEQELDAIVLSDDSDRTGIYPGQVLLDDAFTLEAMQANIEFRRILHIATHAEFAPSRPEDSFIVLGNGERMSIKDIEVMQESLRDLHLVVLSACKTALGGTAGDGTEIAGISSYFLAANRAETVIASLWSVNDDSTSLLMQRFYELLASGELTKAEALRQAQLSLLYDDDTEARLAAARAGIVVEARDGSQLPGTRLQHPYHWAPFILIGNGL